MYKSVEQLKDYCKCPFDGKNLCPEFNFLADSGEIIYGENDCQLMFRNKLYELSWNDNKLAIRSSASAADIKALIDILEDTLKGAEDEDNGIALVFDSADYKEITQVNLSVYWYAKQSSVMTSDNLKQMRLKAAKNELTEAHRIICEAHRYLQSYPDLAEYTDKMLKSLYSAIQDLNGMLK